MNKKNITPISSLPLSKTIQVWLGAGLLVLLGILSYANSLDTPFLFDDMAAIVENPAIRHVWSPGNNLPLAVNGGVTTAGRPLTNLTLALNFSAGYLQIRGYHIFNLTMHLCGGLVMFGLIRRMFLQEKLRDRFGKESLPLALFAAILWVTHPLNTESVTYIVQRAELLAGFFTLLTLYCHVKANSCEKSQWRWKAGAIAACYLAVGCKETGAMASLLVLLHDWIFSSEKGGQIFRQRWRYYLLLLLAWCWQISLIASTGNRGGTTGFSEAMPWWKYLLTQAWAIATYLKLSFWPAPLIFDYGNGLVTSPMEIAGPLVLVVILFFLTVYAIRKKYPAGFAGGCFFLILAPSSSILPVLTQTVAEHRMYLPVAAVITMFVASLYLIAGRKFTLALAPGLVLTTVFLTHTRNHDYRSGYAIWRDTAGKKPENARAWINMGSIFVDEGHLTAGLALFERARELQPGNAEIYFNKAFTLSALGDTAGALRQYQTAVLIRPRYYQAYNSWGNLLTEMGDYPAAAGNLEKALEINPSYADAHYNLGRLYKRLGNSEKSKASFAKALQLDPDLLQRRRP